MIITVITERPDRAGRCLGIRVTFIQRPAVGVAGVDYCANMTSRRWQPGFVSVVVITAVSCGSGQDEFRSDPAPATAVSAPPGTTVPVTTVPADDPANWPEWQMTVTWEGTGDRQSFTLRIGSFKPTGDVSGASSSPCLPDVERDLVAPFEIEISNANDAGFSFAPELEFGAVDYGVYRDPLVLFSIGDECQDVGENGGLGGGKITARTLEPGEEIRSSGFLVLPGARSPQFPNGDPAMWESIHLTLPDLWEQDIVSKSGAWPTDPQYENSIPLRL